VLFILRMMKTMTVIIYQVKMIVKKAIRVKWTAVAVTFTA